MPVVGERPDEAVKPADASLAGRVGAKLNSGIGAFGDWTLTIVRTDLGREIMVKMLQDGVIEGRPGDDDPGAIALLRKLSTNQRKRWPETAVPGPQRRPPRNRPRRQPLVAMPASR